MRKTIVLLALTLTWSAQARDWFDDWHNSDKWVAAGDAALRDNSRLLAARPGRGVLINGADGKCPSLVTKRRDYRDVEVHLEFMVAKGSNSGVIFHGNHEIQILDSFGIKEPTAGHCGGVYPRAESKPTYRHIDRGSPPRVNAARPAGRWQTMDIVFQAARFDENGNKTTHARFVKVVHNGKVIQEDVEVPYACGTNWDRKQYPQGPIIIQGDYGPIAVRNVRIRELKAGEEKKLNVPPEGFTALFNGRDLTGWHTPPLVREYWSIEDGVLKSPGLIESWGASLSTKKLYRDFVLMLDFRMPTISDSGINFRRLIPEIPGFGDMEQFNLRSRGGMGHLESYYFLPEETAKKMKLAEDGKPHVRHIDPEVGVWHTVKLTMQGRTFSAEYDGEVILDNFRYHDWMISTEPAPIRLQKHIVVRGDNLGDENPCPIEYRNIFIKELEAGAEQSAKQTGKTPAGSGDATRTNVILIMADDIGYECYGSYGGTSYKTPVLDKMAAEGMRFRHAYSNPLCTPTRVKIMTGLSNVRNYASFSTLKKTERTIGHMMQDAGYRTAVAGKWQLYGAEHYGDLIRGKGSLPQEMGFDRHCLWQVKKLGSRFWGPTITIDGNVKKFGEDVYGPDVYCKFLLDRMEEYKDEPFFLYYPMALVHSPFVPTPDSADRNCKDKQRNFADMVAYMDKIVGRIVDKTVELGISERTLILVTGDNGTHKSIKSNMGDKVIVGGKGLPTDAGTRVGFFAYQPGAVPAGKVSGDLIEFSDFAPTIADATGAAPLLTTDGRSFFPQLRGETGSPRDTIFVYYWPRPEKDRPLRFVRNKRWKLYDSGRLFDVANDVLEQNPVTGPQTDAIRRQLKAVMDRMPAKGQTLLKFD